MAPGVFPSCGCHYTTDDDGIHYCPLHEAAPDLLAACEAFVRCPPKERHDIALEDTMEAAIAKAKGGA